MAKKKTPAQKKNTNASKGKAAANHDTLADEVTNAELSTTIAFSSYPPILLDDDPDPDVQRALQLARNYYDVYITGFANLEVIWNPAIDKFMLADICIDCVIKQKLQIEALKKPILEELNGNTNSIQTKENPAVAALGKKQKVIMQQLNEMGLTAKSRLIFLEKASTIKSLDANSATTGNNAETNRSLESYKRT